MVPTRPERSDPSDAPAGPSVSVEPTLPGPAEPARATPAEQQEVDVWWGSYSPRTMIPVFALCALLSVTITALAGWLWDEAKAHPQLMWHLTVLLLVLVWLFPLLLCGYRAAASNYRLTTGHLFRDRGFHHPPSDGERDLARVTAVRVRYTTLGRWFHVGQVCVDAEGAPRSLVLKGVHEPERVADLIRGCAQRAREHRGAARTV